MTKLGLPTRSDPVADAGGLMLDDIPPADSDAAEDEAGELDALPPVEPWSGSGPDDGPLIP
jgi:hypothetical protein